MQSGARSARIAARVARALVRLAAMAVPRPLRDRFVGEWQAELWHETRLPSVTAAGLLRTALGAFAAARSWRTLEEASGARLRTRPTAGFLTDVRVAARSLVRSPAFALASILTLSLGLGGTAAMYTLVDRVLLDPLPYPEAERLVSLSNHVPGVSADDPWAMSTAQKVFYDEHARTLEETALYYGTGANVDTPDGPIRSYGWSTTSSLFALTGARARVGRLLDVNDDMPGTADVVVLSAGFWASNFGGDPAIVGRTLTIHGRPFEVVGVLDRRIDLPEEPAGAPAAFWTALKIDPGGTFYNSHGYPMIARLAAGATPEQAERELRALRSRLPERFPRAYSQAFFDQYGFDTRVQPLKDRVVGGVARNLWVVLGSMAVVLLLATLNVANLTAVRLEARERELAVRSAMGAGHGLVLRHLLAESSVLVGISAIVSWTLASAALAAVGWMGGENLPRMGELSAGTASVAATLVLASVLIAGLTAWATVRLPRLSSAALLGSRVAVGSGRPRRGGHAVLVVAQVALALALAVWGGLLARSLGSLAATDPGVRPGELVVGEIHLTPGRFANDGEMWAAYRSILDAVTAIPGVESAGMAQQVPLASGFGCIVQGFEDRSVYDRLEREGRTTCAAQSATTPGYFATMGIPVVRGRDFTDLDNDAPETGAVIVSEAFAERFWPDRDPIGQGVAPHGRDNTFHRVVGVVGDVAGSDLESETPMAIYYPIRQHALVEGYWNWMPTSIHLTVRLRDATMATVLPHIRAAVVAVDPGAPLAGVTSLDDLIRQATERLRLTTWLLVLAAGLALLLATVGVYGVVSYLVARRTREIGLRVAVGAAPGQVRGRFVRQSLGLVLVGLALGAGLALASGRALEGLLHGVSATDPLALAGATATLTVVGLLASWVPARRAARLDPMEALRAD